MAEWRDLVDPTADELLAAVGVLLPEVLVEQLAAPPDPGRRPRLTGGHGWIAGTLQVPVLAEAEDRLYHQEVGLVLTSERAVTVRKTPPGADAFDPAGLREAYEADSSLASGRIAYRLLDEVAERYLDVEDSLNVELDELDENMDEWRPERIRRRIADLRRDILDIRRTLGPTRDAVRRVVDTRLDTGGERVAEDELRPLLAEVYDKLLRASEALDLTRDLLAAAREQHQARIAQEQNDVIKKLAVIASLLLLPTFIVGNYGQNFTHMPELEWRLGYLFSWALIVLTTVAQLAFYRWRRWI